MKSLNLSLLTCQYAPPLILVVLVACNLVPRSMTIVVLYGIVLPLISYLVRLGLRLKDESNAGFWGSVIIWPLYACAATALYLALLLAAGPPR